MLGRERSFNVPWHTVALSSDELGPSCLAAIDVAAPPAAAADRVSCGGQLGQHQDDGDRRATKRRSSEEVKLKQGANQEPMKLASIPAAGAAAELATSTGLLQLPAIRTQAVSMRSCFELHNTAAAAEIELPLDAAASKSLAADDGLPPRQPRRRALLSRGSLSGAIAAATGRPQPQPLPPCLMRTLSLGSVPADAQEHRASSLPGRGTAATGAESSMMEVMGRRFSSSGEVPPWLSEAGHLPALPTDAMVVVARVVDSLVPTPEGGPLRVSSCGALACHTSVTPTAMLTPVGCFDFGPHNGGRGSDADAEGFRILTVLTCGSDDVSLGGERGSSERQVRRERHRRAAAAVEPPSGAFQPAMLLHQCETGDGGECPFSDDCEEEQPCDQELGSQQQSPWQPRHRSEGGDLGRAGSTPGFKQDLFGASSPDSLPWLQPDDGFETPASPAGERYKQSESQHG